MNGFTLLFLTRNILCILSSLPSLYIPRSKTFSMNLLPNHFFFHIIQVICSGISFHLLTTLSEWMRWHCRCIPLPIFSLSYTCFNLSRYLRICLPPLFLLAPFTSLPHCIRFMKATYLVVYSTSKMSFIRFMHQELS